MTRVWVGGILIMVHVDARSIPKTFVWEGQFYVVTHRANRWRADQNWWQERIWRDYFKLDTSNGLILVLFQDLLTGEWYLERVYD
jgi:hypothetical protein